MKNILLKKFPSIDYALIVKVQEDGTPKEIIAAYGYDDETGSWSQGHYFADIYGALSYLRDLLVEANVMRIDNINTVLGKSYDWLLIPCIREMECPEIIIKHLNEIGNIGSTTYEGCVYTSWESLLNSEFDDYVFEVRKKECDGNDFRESYLVGYYKKGM